MDFSETIIVALSYGFPETVNWPPLFVPHFASDVHRCRIAEMRTWLAGLWTNIERQYDFDIWAYTHPDTVKEKYLGICKKGSLQMVRC